MAMRRRVGGGSGQSTAVNTAVAAGNSEGGAVATDPDDLKRDLYKYEDDMGDSKGPRLTLMEEVLLLGLKDREVRHYGCSGVEMHTQSQLCKHTYTIAQRYPLPPFLSIFLSSPSLYPSPPSSLLPSPYLPSPPTCLRLLPSPYLPLSSPLS